MRLIDADLLRGRIIAFCTGCSTTYLTVENIVMMINQADTVDAVPVVRCRDCKYLYTDEYGFLACAESGAMLDPEDDDYCSRGQRRDQFAGGGKTGGQNDADQH